MRVTIDGVNVNVRVTEADGGEIVATCSNITCHWATVWASGGVPLAEVVGHATEHDDSHGGAA